jgi:hypothetical protein
MNWRAAAEQAADLQSPAGEQYASVGRKRLPNLSGDIRALADRIAHARHDADVRGRLFVECCERGLRRLPERMPGPGLGLDVSASDLIQETICEADRGFASFRGAAEAELLAWLRQILGHNVADQLRRRVDAHRLGAGNSECDNRRA